MRITKFIGFLELLNFQFGKLLIIWEKDFSVKDD